MAETEEYNGTSWTEVTDMPTVTTGNGGGGIQTAAFLLVEILQLILEKTLHLIMMGLVGLQVEIYLLFQDKHQHVEHKQQEFIVVVHKIQEITKQIKQLTTMVHHGLIVEIFQ